MPRLEHRYNTSTSVAVPWLLYSQRRQGHADHLWLCALAASAAAHMQLHFEEEGSEYKRMYLSVVHVRALCMAASPELGVPSSLKGLIRAICRKESVDHIEGKAHHVTLPSATTWEMLRMLCVHVRRVGHATKEGHKM
mgnify:CR=1 FL=1